MGLSRGAASCDFVDTSRVVTARINEHLGTLGATHRARCHTASADEFIEGAEGPFDIVFVDPPFSLGLAENTCTLLARANLVRDQGLVYLETDAATPLPTLPGNWTVHRDKVAGDVAYRLFRVAARGSH